MPDEQTLQDHNEDLMIELREARKQIERWERIARAAFKQAGDDCITGCRGACMCTCGFEHFRYETRHERRNG